MADLAIRFVQLLATFIASIVVRLFVGEPLRCQDLPFDHLFRLEQAYLGCFEPKLRQPAVNAKLVSSSVAKSSITATIE